ncbi:hypothetical protein LCGC14_1315490 [marine sediment metagenome]|uniref:Uncharacterized protein n=1 Tax=marine sediment metagenome TaxID=412755 RepID=A0A0F9NNG6_9ZZZZ
MAKKRPTNCTAINMYKPTRDLLNQIIAMPGNGRSAPVMMHILVRAEAARLGLIEGPERKGNFCPKCDHILGIDLEADKLICGNPACTYRC